MLTELWTQGTSKAREAARHLDAHLSKAQCCNSKCKNSLRGLMGGHPSLMSDIALMQYQNYLSARQH